MDRDIGIASKMSSLHIPLGNASRNKNPMKHSETKDSLLRGSKPRLGNDLCQRSSRTVEINTRLGGGVGRFSSVLFQVDSVNFNGPQLTVCVEGEFAVRSQGLVVLRKSDTPYLNQGKSTAFARMWRRYEAGSLSPAQRGFQDGWLRH